MEPHPEANVSARVPAAQGNRRAAAWLATGVVLTTATQLRLGASVGPGELILLAWCAASALAVLRGGRPALAPTLRPFALFWAVSIPLLLAGWGVAWSWGIAAPGAPRDFLAYAFIAAIIACLAYKPGGEDELRSAGRLVIVACTLVLFLLLLYAGLSPSLGPLHFWHRGRFIGWSNNPNQVPLGVILTPFLALHGLTRWGGARERYGLAVLACCSLAVGLSSESDALVLAWSAGAAVLAAHSWLLALRGRSIARRGKILLAVAPLLVAAPVIVDGRAVDRVARGIAAIWSGQEKGAERPYLWGLGLEAVAASPVVGLGPGAHARVRRPWGEIPSEAHNIYVDWASATGLMGSLLLFGLLLHVARSAVRAPALFAALSSLLVFGLAHHYLRHPIVWGSLLLIAQLGRNSMARAETRRNNIKAS